MDHGTPEQRDGYEKCVNAMAEAARLWMRQHPFAELHFNNFEPDMAREMGRPGEKVAVIAALPHVIDRWAGNADTRAFLRAMDEASHGEATYQQARAIVHSAMENALERSQGMMPDGRWGCPSCAMVLTGFTNTSGTGNATPGPGAMSVCAYCSSFLRVNAAGKGFEIPTTQEFNKLPKGFRKKLLAIKNVTIEMQAKKKSRS